MISILVVTLIGFGLAHTGAKLDGPFGLAAALRTWVQSRPNAPAWAKTGVDCVYCHVFYWTLLASLGVAWGPEFVVTWLAGFGLACFLFLYTGH